jgi:hypothetical protein
MNAANLPSWEVGCVLAESSASRPGRHKVVSEPVRRVRDEAPATTIVIVGSEITSICAGVFVRLVSIGIFTDAEIVEWLRSNRPAEAQKPQVTEAIVKLVAP